MTLQEKTQRVFLTQYNSFQLRPFSTSFSLQLTELHCLQIQYFHHLFVSCWTSRAIPFSTLMSRA